MSQHNIDFLRDGYARFNAGEKTAELWFWLPDAEYHVAREDPDSAVHRGIDAIRGQFASWIDAYPDLRIEILEAKDSGDQVFRMGALYGTRRRERHPARDGAGARLYRP